MINPIILKFMSSLLNSDASKSAMPSASGDGGKHFLSDMQKALRTFSNKSDFATHESIKANTDSYGKGYKNYLESFKKELLAQGKPLNEIFLKEKDFPLIKKFLLQCGFSNKKIDGFLKDLKSDSPGGQINLSYFFQKASELESPKDKAYHDKIIASNAIPHIESILRDFQFTPKEMDNLISYAKTEGGGLDLKQFVNKLKEISSRKPFADNNGVDRDVCQKIISKMEAIGISVKNKEKIEQISPEDFIASLEQTLENVNQNDKSSSEIKKTLDNLVKRVTRSDQNITSASSVKVASNYNFTNSLIEEQTNKNHNHLFDKKPKSSSENITNKNDVISSFLKQEGDKITPHAQLIANTSNPKQRADIFSDLNKKMGLMNPVERDSDHILIKTGQMDAPRNTATFNLAGTVKSAPSNNNGSGGYYLQASLIDQVGKQISRSILTGDRIVRLQLNPPELGTVKIKMDMKDHSLRIGIITEHHSVKELLLNNIHQLREALLHQGVKLDKVDVQIDYNFGQSLNSSKQGTNSGPGTGRGFNEKQFNTNSLTQETSAIQMHMISKNNLLDLVA